MTIEEAVATLRKHGFGLESFTTHCEAEEATKIIVTLHVLPEVDDGIGVKRLAEFIKGWTKKRV